MSKNIKLCIVRIEKLARQNNWVCINIPLQQRISAGKFYWRSVQSKVVTKQSYAQELEESRASWNVVKAKTAESEEQWVKLKADFAERKRCSL